MRRKVHGEELILEIEQEYNSHIFGKNPLIIILNWIKSK